MRINKLILITVDSLRADHLSCYGYHKLTSPNIDELARRSCVFYKCFSTSCFTYPSLISLHTSLYPSMWSPSINHIVPTIAVLLSKLGFTTIGIHSNPFLLRSPIPQGFELFIDILQGKILKHKVRKRNESKHRKAWKITFNEKLRRIEKYIKGSRILYRPLAFIYSYLVLTRGGDKANGESIVNYVLELFEKINEPFFIWMHFMDVHYRYNPPDDYLKEVHGKSISTLKRAWLYSKMKFAKLSESEKEAIVSLYDGAIRYVDKQIGSLVKFLKEHGVLNTTYLIITSDHGEEFGEHGDYGHFKPKLYNELLHVPLIIYGPGISTNEIRCTTSLIDLAPTILDLLGIKKATFMLGRSLKPIMEGVEEDRPAISEIKDLISYQDNRYKLIVNIKTGHKELYDLENDPREQNPITSSKLVKDYEEKVKKYLLMRSNMRKILFRESVRSRIKTLKLSRNV